METEHKCQVETYRGASIVVGAGYCSPCDKIATILTDKGEWVCYYHSPKAIAKREEEKRVRWDIQAMNRRKGIGRKQRTL